MTKFGRYGGPFLMAATLFLLSIPAGATPLAGSSIGVSDLDAVAVNLQYIDFDFTGTSTGNPPVYQSGVFDGSGVYAAPFRITTATGDFSAAGLQFTNVGTSDLCRSASAGPPPTSGPCANPAAVGATVSVPFMQFSNGWTITLTELLPGDFTAAGCAGAPGSGVAGQTCTPPLSGGSPFDITNNGNSPGGPVTGVGIQFTFLGTIDEGAGGTAPVKGTLNTTFSGTDLQTILADILAGDTVVSSAGGTLSIQSGVPEPNTLAFFVIGGLLIGATRIRRKRA